MKRKVLTLIAAITLAGCGANNTTSQQTTKEPIRVACIGNSITEGYALAKQSETAWPTFLAKTLGDNYIVINCGRGATTLQKEGDFSYWTVNEFSNAIQLRPNIVVIKHGSNDSKPMNWNQERFKRDYQALIDTLMTIDPKPRIILCYPAPAFSQAWTISDSTIVNGVIPVIDEIAEANNLEMIDFHEALKNDSINFPDHIHPNEVVTAKMAEMVKEVILKK